MAACSSCSGSGSIMSQRMVYTSQGSYETLVYDPCTRCGTSGSIKDRNLNQNTEPMGLIDSVSAMITSAVSIFTCWIISETTIYSELTLNEKFILMVASLIFSFIATGVILTFPFIHKLIGWAAGIVALFFGLVILVSFT